MGDQHQGGVGLVRAVPVQVEKVAIGQPQALALALQAWCVAQQRGPECLGMGAGQPPGGLERSGGGEGHGWLSWSPG